MIPPHSINAWIGDKNFFYNHPDRGDWVKLHLDWFDNLSNTIEIPSPMACKEDFLFDYPALKNRGWSASLPAWPINVARFILFAIMLDL